MSKKKKLPVDQSTINILLREYANENHWSYIEELAEEVYGRARRISIKANCKGVKNALPKIRKNLSKKGFLLIPQKQRGKIIAIKIAKPEDKVETGDELEASQKRVIQSKNLFTKKVQITMQLNLLPEFDQQKFLIP